MNTKALFIMRVATLLAVGVLTGCISSGTCTSTSCPDPTTVNTEQDGAQMSVDTTVKKGWSTSGSLTDGDSTGTVQLQAAFEEPGAYSVEFNIDDPTGSQALTEATIQWSVEGNTVRRRVSVANGVTVSGVGQSVRVVVQDKDPPGGSGGKYGVSIQVSRGTRASSSQSPTLAAFDSNNGALVFIAVAGGLPGAATVPIPQDAGVIAVGVTVSYQSTVDPGLGGPNGTPIPETGAIVIQHDAAGNIAKIYDPRDPGNFWVPIAPGCKEIDLVSYCGKDLAYSVTFEIDG